MQEETPWVSKGSSELNEVASWPAPSLTKGCFIELEKDRRSFVLNAPQGNFELNRSGAEILMRCDGALEIEMIIGQIERQFNVQGIALDVYRFLFFASEQGWIE
jgi:pyrroloquinoline quinone biosynthesis protein D